MMKIPRIRIKKPSKRALIILSVVLMIFLAFVIPVGVTYAKSMDEMIPSDGSTGTLYNKYNPSHYSFQTTMPDRHFWQVGAKATDGINSIYDHTLSMIFLGSVQVTRFFNFVAREAFTFSFMDSLITGVEQIIQNVTGIKGGKLGNGMWNSMFGVVASVTLAFVLWQVIRLKFLDSLQTMFSFILALVVALAFFSNAGTFLRFLNDSGNQLATSMYAGLATPGGLSTSTTTGVQAISEQVWMELVMKPYSMLQFDDASAYEKHPDIVNKVLKTVPYSDERDAALKAAAATFPAVERVRSDEQMIILLCNTIFSAIILGLFCYWAIATIFIRIKLLIHATVMSITLLASLLPGREAGLSVVRGQFLKLIGLVMMTVFTMFFLDLSLVIGHLTFNIVTKANGGWFTAMLLETIVVFVVFKYREEIGSVFSKAAGNIPMMPKAKSTVLDAVQRNVTRSLYNKAGAAIGGMFNRKEPEGVPSTFNPNSLSKAGNSLNDATTASMQLRYQREREASEQHASETGQPVQYTPYVQKVNENLRNGTKNPFRGMDKEWKEEKARLGDIQKDGGDVKQAILAKGVTEGMNDQQVAATMYSNENAIRQASSFMVNRPKSAIGQMQRAGTLNKNRKLETSVNDFVMVELFEKYKMEYKWAVDTAAATGEPVQHSDFVKNMDDRFKAAGLNTTQKVNDTMLTRKGRIGISSKFESMPEFGSKRDDLLRANEAFLRASTQEGVTATVAPVSIAAPISTASIQKNIPALPTATTKRDLPLTITGHPEIRSDIDMSKVKLPNNLKQSMNDAKAKLADSSSLDPGDRLEINTETNTQVFTTLKQRVSHEVSTDLEAMNNELQIMKKASNRKFTEADSNNETVSIINKASQNAQQTRQSKTLTEPAHNQEAANTGNHFSPNGRQSIQHRTVTEPISNHENLTVVKNSSPSGQQATQHRTVKESAPTKETVSFVKNQAAGGQQTNQQRTNKESAPTKESVTVVKNQPAGGSQATQHRTVIEPANTKETVTFVKNQPAGGQQANQQRTVKEPAPAPTKETVRNQKANGQQTKQPRTVKESAPAPTKETVTVVKNQPASGQQSHQQRTVKDSVPAPTKETVTVVKNQKSGGQQTNQQRTVKDSAPAPTKETVTVVKNQPASGQQNNQHRMVKESVPAPTKETITVVKNQKSGGQQTNQQRTVKDSAPAPTKETITVVKNQPASVQQSNQHRTVKETVPAPTKETVTVVKNQPASVQQSNQHRTVKESVPASTKETVTIVKNQPANGQQSNQHRTVKESVPAPAKETVTIIKNSTQKQPSRRAKIVTESDGNTGNGNVINSSPDVQQTRRLKKRTNIQE